MATAERQRPEIESVSGALLPAMEVAAPVVTIARVRRYIEALTFGEVDIAIEPVSAQGMCIDVDDPHVLADLLDRAIAVMATRIGRRLISVTDVPSLTTSVLQAEAERLWKEEELHLRASVPYRMARWRSFLDVLFADTGMKGFYFLSKRQKKFPPNISRSQLHAALLQYVPTEEELDDLTGAVGRQLSRTNQDAGMPIP